MKSAERTQTQNRRFWAIVRDLVKQHGLDQADAEAILRDEVESVSGQRSTRALTSAQARMVIAKLSARLPQTEGRSGPDGRKRRASAVRPPESARPPKDSTGEDSTVITRKQMAFLTELSGALGMDARAYRGFCRRVIKTPWPQTRAQAIKIHEGLEAMTRRRFTGEVLATLTGRILAHPDVSIQDSNFARSVQAGGRKRRRMSAGQITILIKIGRRYGLQALSDNA